MLKDMNEEKDVKKDEAAVEKAKKSKRSRNSG